MHPIKYMQREYEKNRALGKKRKRRELSLKERMDLVKGGNGEHPFENRNLTMAQREVHESRMKNYRKKQRQSLLFTMLVALAFVCLIIGSVVFAIL